MDMRELRNTRRQRSLAKEVQMVYTAPYLIAPEKGQHQSQPPHKELEHNSVAISTLAQEDPLLSSESSALPSVRFLLPPQTGAPVAESKEQAPSGSSSDDDDSESYTSEISDNEQTYPVVKPGMLHANGLKSSSRARALHSSALCHLKVRYQAAAVANEGEQQEGEKKTHSVSLDANELLLDSVSFVTMICVSTALQVHQCPSVPSLNAAASLPVHTQGHVN